MNLKAIVLKITPIITLIEDQKRKLRQKNVSTLPFIAATVKVNPNI